MTKSPPAQFAQIPNISSHTSPKFLAHYWVWFVREGQVDRCWYLFGPDWPDWYGAGYWRCGYGDRKDWMSPLCTTPEELWAYYLAYRLTGEW